MQAAAQVGSTKQAQKGPLNDGLGVQDGACTDLSSPGTAARVEHEQSELCSTVLYGKV